MLKIIFFPALYYGAMATHTLVESDKIQTSVFLAKSEQIVNPNKYHTIPKNRQVIDDKCSDFIYRPNAA